MTSTDKVIELLTFLKEVTQVPDDQLNAIGTKLGELQAAVVNEIVAGFNDPVGESEIHSFASAAHALTPLDEETRQRALDALQALLLPPRADWLDRLTPAFQGALPALAAAFQTAPFVAPSSVRAPADGVPQGQDVDAPFSQDDRGAVIESVESGSVIIRMPDGKRWLVFMDGSRKEIIE